MAYQSHFDFDLQLFAESEPQDIRSILSQIEEVPFDSDGLPVEVEREPEQAEQGEADTTAEEEYDEITYNKETVRIPKSERQTYLQKGYNYDKVHGRLQQAEAQNKAVDEWVAANYSDSGIKTWSELQARLQMQARQQALEDAGLDEASYKALLESDPELQRLRAEAEQARKLHEEQIVNDRMDAEVKALNETYGLSLQTIDDIIKLPNADRMIELATQTKLPLTECYFLANKEEIIKQRVEAAEQKTLTQVTSKAHVKSAGKGVDSGDVVHVPADVRKMYKTLWPSITDKEISERYAKRN